MRDALRFAAPQVLTGARIVVAVFAVVFALRQQQEQACTLLLLGLFTDALDGVCARMLGVASEFGQLFDFFADYLYFVVAPAVISVSLVEPAGGLTLFLLSLPCVFAALRYARKAMVSETEFPGTPGSPGVPTIAYALFVIAVALLSRRGVMPPAVTGTFLETGAPLLGILMIVRTRYPKLSVYLWILIPILSGLAAMPFVLTEWLAAVTILLIAAYVLVGPALVRQSAASGARINEASRRLCP